MIFRARLMAIALLVGAAACQQAPQPAAPPTATAGSASTRFVNISGKQFNTVHANDFHFYEELNAVVQHEPADFLDPEVAGLFAAIGIQKGRAFAPDARMKAGADQPWQRLEHAPTALRPA